MPQKEYTKLTPARQKSGFAIISTSRSRLWLGRDHVLLVITDGYTESYKRFYFRDIQAFVLRKSERLAVIAWTTGALMILCASVALAANGVAVRWVFGVLAAVVAIPFVVNFLLGPTCFCQLRTAVQTEEIPALGRVRRARKVIARLRPLIAEAQGQMTSEEVETRMREWAQPSAATGPSPSAPGPASASTPVSTPESAGPAPEAPPRMTG